MVECWILWCYLLGQVVVAQVNRQYSMLASQPKLMVQTKTQEITNNLMAGTVGGFIGTALNTPCKFDHLGVYA